jgi:membrane associated rhomboid family serine protease
MKQLAQWVIATPSNVFEHGRVWTLVTGPLIEPDFVALVLSVLVMWMFVPTLERFWGTNRFYRFVIITSIAGSIGGCLIGLATGRNVAIAGLAPFVYASIVAFGILYAKQPVEFSFYIRLTGRQLMYGFLGFLVLFVTIQGLWEKGGSFAAAMLAAAVMTSKRWSPGLMWRRWRIARARARLSVIEGGAPPKPKRRDEGYLN